MPRPSYARFARGADEGVRPYTSDFKLRLAGGWPILCNYCKGWGYRARAPYALSRCIDQFRIERKLSPPPYESRRVRAPSK